MIQTLMGEALGCYRLVSNTLGLKNTDDFYHLKLSPFHLYSEELQCFQCDIPGNSVARLSKSYFLKWLILACNFLSSLHFSSILVNVNYYISHRNPLDSDTEVIKVYNPLSKESKAFISAITASGFARKPNNFTDDIYHSFLPCPVGTFSNTTSKGKEGCTPCSPGYCYSIYFNLQVQDYLQLFLRILQEWNATQ